jgi:class 3 adenylate cyclase
MSWNEARSRKRIRDHLQTVPQFDDHISLSAMRGRVIAEDSGLMSSLPTRRAKVVEGAHLYGQLLDFDNLVADQYNIETEDSHRNVLRFLNMHYRLWDTIVDDDESDRVDYHGARLHAIVPSPEGDRRGQVARAVALAQKLNDATRRIATAYGFPARIRFGIDQGKCLAMTTGRNYERDTLFFGSPANHAAKLAAARDEEGIYIAPNAQAVIESTSYRKTGTGDVALDSRFLAEATSRNPFAKLDEAVSRLTAEARQEVLFVFHRPTPPLSALKFEQLSPANSARLGMASIFADIDGFTNFVDATVSQGNNGIKHAATAVHVIREELNDVLKEDNGGKRVRFIGDCIHGVLAEGRLKDDAAAAIDAAIMCAAGMKDSFSLCQEMLGGIDKLGLAIGIEFGPVPLTRIGLRGEDSVRCAAGRAVIESERQQQSLQGGGIKLGPEAQRLAKPSTARLLAKSTRLLGYDATADLIGSMASPAVAAVQADRTARPYFHTEESA